MTWDWESLVISEGSLPDLEINSNREGDRLEVSWQIESEAEYDELVFVSINKTTATPESMSVQVTDSKAQFELESNEVLFVFRQVFVDGLMKKSMSEFLG